MAEEEYYTDEEVEEEEEVEPPPPPKVEAAPEAEPEEEPEAPAPQSQAEEAVAPREEVKLRRAPPPQPKEPDTSGESMTEAEKAMLAAKKRHEEEEAAKMLDYEERRRRELQQLEQELAELKVQQQRRLEERKQEEAEFAERRRKDDERRRQEEEARKARMEEEKERRELEKRKRQMMMAGAFCGGGPVEGGGPNFTVTKKEREDGAPEGSTGRKKGRSAEEIADAKRNYMSIVNRPADVSNMMPNDIKVKIKQLYARIVKLEGDKYDLEQRKSRQEYDLKELEARRQQEARNKALKMGLGDEEMQIGKHPPKILVASRFDRQIDRRGYGDKRELFENPYVKPAPSIAHGSGRPPSEWGRKEFEELENIRKNLEPPKYVEQVKAEGDMAKPPVPIVPMQLPSGDFDEPVKEEPAPPVAPEKKKKARA